MVDFSFFGVYLLNQQIYEEYKKRTNMQGFSFKVSKFITIIFSFNGSSKGYSFNYHQSTSTFSFNLNSLHYSHNV